MTAGYTRINDTGNRATIVFAASAIAADFNMIGEIPQEGGAIEDSALENVDWQSFIPMDLANPGKQDCELNFNDKTTLPPLHTPGLITITFPLRPGYATQATFVGTGFLTKRTVPQLKNGVLQTSKISIQWDGKGTIPAFTAAT